MTFEVKPHNNRKVSGIEQGQILQEIVASGLVGDSPDERRVFLATLGIDYADSFTLAGALPDFLSEVCERLANQWRLGQFLENFRQFRDRLEDKSLPYHESANEARANVCSQHLESFITYAKRLPLDVREQLKTSALRRISEELGS